jgi:hypothetical protein
MKNDLAVFEGYQIRRHYDEKNETWWFSVVDIIRVLTQQPDYQTARKYWNKLKERLGKEGNQSVTNCHQLKMPAADGKSCVPTKYDNTTNRPLAEPTPGGNRSPSASAITYGMPASTVAMSELVVPRSMPTMSFIALNLKFAVQSSKKW